VTSAALPLPGDQRPPVQTLGGWWEPARGVPLRRGTYSGRYAASLLMVVLGSYLLVTAPLGQLYFSRDIVEFAVAAGMLALDTAIVLAGILIAPASAVRRVVAAAVVAVSVGADLTFLTLWFGRLVSVPPEVSGLLARAIHPTVVVPTVVAVAWLIIRYRPAVSLVLPLAGAAVLIVGNLNLVAGLDYPLTALLPLLFGSVVGVGVAWIARRFAVQRERRDAAAG
jgi:hypothetical protein